MDARWVDILCVSIEVIALVLCIYLLATLVAFLRSRSYLGNKTCFVGGRNVRIVLMTLFATYILMALMKSLLAVAFFIMERNGSNSTLCKEVGQTHQFLHAAGNGSNSTLCKEVGQTHQFLHTAGSIVLYFYLWYRQHTLYNNKFLKKFATKCLIRFSYLLVVVIFCAGSVALTAVFFTVSLDDFELRNNSCYFTKKLELEPNDLIIYPAFGLIFAIHGCILFLFVYVLRRHQANISSLQEATSRTSTSMKRIRKLVRSCVVASAVSAISDIVFLILDNTLRDWLTLMISNTMWDIDMVINLLCVLVCFTQWKEMIFPWQQHQDRKNSRSDGTLSGTGARINAVSFRDV